MAIFKTKTKASTAPAKKSGVNAATPRGEAKKSPGLVLIRPHLSEKALLQGVSNVYAFEVHEDATKRQVAEAVEEAYSKKPVKVNIVSMPGKPTSARFKGRPGKKGKMKKAYVYLKKGDTLQLI